MLSKITPELIEDHYSPGHTIDAPELKSTEPELPPAAGASFDADDVFSVGPTASRKVKSADVEE